MNKNIAYAALVILILVIIVQFSASTDALRGAGVDLEKIGVSTATISAFAAAVIAFDYYQDMGKSGVIPSF
jgi:hypothetical protein